MKTILLNIIIICTISLNPTAIFSSHLTTAQDLARLKGAVQLKKQHFDNQLRLWIGELRQLHAQLPAKQQAFTVAYIDEIEPNIAAMDSIVTTMLEPDPPYDEQNARQAFDTLEQRLQDIENLYYGPTKQAITLMLDQIQEAGSTTITQETIESIIGQAVQEAEAAAALASQEAPTPQTDEQIIHTLETKLPVAQPAPTLSVIVASPEPAPDTHPTDTSATDAPLVDTSAVDTSAVDTSAVDTSVVDAVLITLEGEPEKPSTEPATPTSATPTQPTDQPSELPVDDALKTTAAIAQVLADRMIARMDSREMQELDAPFSTNEIEQLRAIARYDGRSAHQVRRRNVAKKIMRQYDL